MTFNKELLKVDATVIGAVSATIYVSSSAPDKDFVATLNDGFPNAKFYNLTDGIIRTSCRGANWVVPPFSRPQAMEPDRIYLMTLEVWATANTFAWGHHTRLDISNSKFPRWDTNLNTGNPGAETGDMDTALQMVCHTNEYPSVLHLFQEPSKK